MRDHETPILRRGLPLLGLTLAATTVLAGCSHVSADDLDAELGSLRTSLQEEMQEGDQQVREDLGQRISDVETRLDALESDLRGLADEFDATVERLESAVRFQSPVFFAFDEAKVRQQDHKVLNRFADVMQSYYPTAFVTVEGFADPAGPSAYNDDLGARRAEAVQEYLVERNLDPERVRTVSYGEARERQVIPGAAGPGEEGMENRRVVLVVDYRSTGEAPATVTDDSEASGSSAESSTEGTSSASLR